MSDFSALIASVESYIRQNGNNEITGNILQEVLVGIISTLGTQAINALETGLSTEQTTRANADAALSGRIDTADGNISSLSGIVTTLQSRLDEGYIYKGIATPSTNPGTPTGKVFYVAVQAGTYTNFGGLTVSQGINIIKYNGSTWSVDVVIGIDDAPTSKSGGLASSGGIYSTLRPTAARANSAYGGYFLDLGMVYEPSSNEYKSSTLYDTAWLCLVEGAANITVTGATFTTIRYFSSIDTLNATTNLGTNTTGIVPDGAKLALVALRKSDNTGGYDNLVITQDSLLGRLDYFGQRGLVCHPNHVLNVSATPYTDMRVQANDDWDCFHYILHGETNINVDGFDGKYFFFDTVDIFGGENIVSHSVGTAAANKTGAVPDGAKICVFSGQKSQYTEGYGNFRTLQDFAANSLVVDKGFFIHRNHALNIASGQYNYVFSTLYDTAITYVQGATKLNISGLPEGANYYFFDSADIFSGEDITSHLIVRNQTGIVPENAVICLNYLTHSIFTEGYDALHLTRSYEKRINLLIFGNSAAQDAVAYVPFILKNMGFANVRIGILMQSDSTIQMHYENFQNEAEAYRFNFIDTALHDSWQTRNNTSAQWALDTYHWDIVNFHQSANSNNAVYVGNIQPWLNLVMNDVAAYVDHNIEFVFYQNQSRPGITNGGANWSDEVITQHYLKTVEFIEHIIQETICEHIIPVGTAIQNARTIPSIKALGDYASNPANTSGLGYLTPDGIHLQEGLPCQIAAYTYILAILKIYGYTEFSINGETTRVTAEWSQGKNIPSPHGSPIASTDANCLIAQKCAIMAMRNPFEVTDMNYIVNPT